MASPEPSFEGFFSTQQRPSAQSSFDLPSKNYNQGAGDHYGGGFGPIQYADEPQSLEPRDLRSEHIQQHHELRKDSVPFDPASSSTLIASVSNGGHPDPNAPSHFADPNSVYQYHQQQQQQSDMAFLQQQASAMGSDQYYDGGLSSAPQTGDWNNSLLQQQQQGSNAGSRRASFTGGLGATPFDDSEQYEELQRIISNASSHGQATPGDQSRAASPFVPADQPSATSSVFPESARSPSPFVAAPSPPVNRSPSGHGSPPFSKPQSPPALVIPQGAPSPQYQPMAAVPVPPPQPTSQFGNSLLPPANPALTGMAGISPIADNADGPMITIQPSTPISGLKEGNGVFDAALRRANAQAAQAAQSSQQGQANGVQSASMATSQTGGPGIPSAQQAFVRDAQQWTQNLDLGNLGTGAGHRPRAKSESYGTGGEQFDRQAMYQVMNNPAMAGQFQQQPQPPQHMNSQDQWINTWRMNNAAAEASNHLTMDPRQLPGQGPGMDPHGLGQINTSAANQDMFKYESGQISPTSMAVYQQLGLNAGAGYTGPDSTNSSPGFMYQQGIAQPVPQSHFLIPETGTPSARRRSFAEGTMHPAAGAGTPGYGIEFTMPGAVTPPGRLRGPYSHRRAVKSEDFSRFGPPGSAPGGSGWGMGQGGSTADFLNAITNPEDGTLLPPSMRGRSYSHSRHSSASSVRSASPALSVSSQGSSFSHHSHMEMPEHMSEHMYEYFVDPRLDHRPKVAKLKVTSMATEVASASRRTNSGIFKCPIPGCGSTFTRHFNLKGHLRSHNDERPYKCLYDGCPKSIVGFARQHDCKRHMHLHQGVRPFECEGCGKKFARLDALTRHHKSEQGQECAISHPLPTNPDGSAMSESQYKAYRLKKEQEEGSAPPDGSQAGPSGTSGAEGY